MLPCSFGICLLKSHLQPITPKLLLSSHVSWHSNLFVSLQAEALELRYLDYHWLLYGPERQWVEPKLLESDNIAVVVLDTDTVDQIYTFQV